MEQIFIALYYIYIQTVWQTRLDGAGAWYHNWPVLQAQLKASSACLSGQVGGHLIVWAPTHLEHHLVLLALP